MLIVARGCRNTWLNSIIEGLGICCSPTATDCNWLSRSSVGTQGNPMAFLVENGGGRAITGAGAVLDLQPRSIHERSPIFLGSKQDIDRIEALHKAGH